jgi:hypothetical protein
LRAITTLETGVAPSSNPCLPANLFPQQELAAGECPSKIPASQHAYLILGLQLPKSPSFGRLQNLSTLGLE